MFHYFESWCNNSTFPSYRNWKNTVRDNIVAFESDLRSQFCKAHPDMCVAQACFENMSSRHMQVKHIGNFGLNGSVSWLKDTEGTLWFFL